VVPPETAHREAVEFDLSGKPQSDQDAERIAGLLGKTSCLTTLKLSRCSLTSTGFATICAALQENTTLEVLDLSANDCEDASRAIAAMLRANRTLKTLDLDNCWLNEENIAEIGEALDGNQALTDLNLLYNIPQNVHALAAILKRNTALTSLTIGCQSSLDCKGVDDSFRELSAC
jgi:Ran GTPase-activating protein (RanGAP) involved in mRNA processing and transport